MDNEDTNDSEVWSILANASSADEYESDSRESDRPRNPAARMLLLDDDSWDSWEPQEKPDYDLYDLCGGDEALKDIHLPIPLKHGSGVVMEEAQCPCKVKDEEDSSVTPNSNSDSTETKTIKQEEKSSDQPGTSRNNM